MMHALAIVALVIAGWGASSVLLLATLHARIAWMEKTGRMPPGQRRWFDDPKAATFFAFAWPILLLFMFVMSFVLLWWYVTPHPDGRRAEREREQRARAASPRLRIIRSQADDYWSEETTKRGSE